MKECSTNDACPMGYQCFVAEKCLHAAQLNAQPIEYENNINARQQSILNQLPIATGWHIVPRDMTAADLGIVDQLLDDKVGMEP